MLERLRAWTHRQQRLGAAAGDPLAALRSVVAVYSSHPTAPLALLARTRGLDAAEFNTLEEARKVVRVLPGMRGSVFLMPTDSAPKIVGATREPLEKLAPRLQYANLTWGEYADLKRRVVDVLAGPMTAEALQTRVPTAARLMTAVRLMSHEGVVLRIGASLRTDNLRYVATEAWLGRPLEVGDADQSLAWLADQYLRGYGPARVADFAWWTGVTRTRAAAALAAVDTVDLGGGLLLPADQEAAFAAAIPVDPDTLDLLPKWDAYTMGLAPDGRQRLVDDAHLQRAYGQKGQAGVLPGDGLPLVLRSGRAVATWSHRFERKRLSVEVTPFEPGTQVDAAVFASVETLLS